MEMLGGGYLKEKYQVETLPTLYKQVYIYIQKSSPPLL